MIGLKKILILSLMVLGVWAIGVSGYMLIEGWNFHDALFMTAITLSTVGYEEVHPLSQPGMAFTIFLILLGVGSFFYVFGVLIDAFLQGHIKGFWEKKRMEKKIESLDGHYIVCGYGRIGKSIALSLNEKGLPVVVIENDPAQVEEIRREGLLWVEGDATRDEVLKEAKVEAAKGIVCVLKSDADNVYITITARWLNPGLLIVARASDPKAETKMVQAGADRVISPYEIGARRMALAILQPTVTEFLDLAVHSSKLDLTIEQIEIQYGSILTGSTIKEAALRQNYGVTILAVQDPERDLILSPGPDLKLKEGLIMVALGSSKALQRLKAVAVGH